MFNDWSAEAFNQEPNSSNEIHGDALAKEYGFQGGLVPGVTISAYLLHPAIETWGMAFLESGRAHVKVISPLYDGEQFQVDITGQSDNAYEAQLTRAGGTVCAQVKADLHDDTAPARRHDPLAEKDFVAPDAQLSVWRALRENGCRAFPFRWHNDHVMATYLRDRSQLPTLLQGEDAFANMAYILGVSNWCADSNVHMNPWVHLETWSQNFHPIAQGTRIVCEMSVVDLFDRKGHEFFDADFNLFDAGDDRALASIRLRAIYKMRGAD